MAARKVKSGQLDKEREQEGWPEGLSLYLVSYSFLFFQREKKRKEETTKRETFLCLPVPHRARIGGQTQEPNEQNIIRQNP